jgi:hypothetical protein
MALKIQRRSTIINISPEADCSQILLDFIHIYNKLNRLRTDVQWFRYPIGGPELGIHEPGTGNSHRHYAHGFVY